MKKNLSVIIGIFIIFALILYLLYANYTKVILSANKVNAEYEKYTENEIIGSSLMTLINKVIDQNEKNDVDKDEEDRYIANDKNSIIIEVKFLEAEETFRMEAIATLGADKFIKNYSNMTFKCTKKEYHSKTKNISYMLFEQI